MNGLINPIKNLFRRVTEPQIVSPDPNPDNEPSSIPWEHSNKPPAHYVQEIEEDDDDFFVYKLSNILKFFFLTL